ncbi:MAG: glutamate--tRNA ligase [Proteobacteria bacterium]|nr:glutamate--tRNA ligase [Pseudomonadota bacterium]
MIEEKLISLLLGDESLQSPSFYEMNYPSRQIVVTRFAPSPTGFVHLGSLYTALINTLTAHQNNGVFFLRIEDTDTERSTLDALKLIIAALDRFRLRPDEGVVGFEQGATIEKGNYGPYVQSKRKNIYHTFVAELLRKGLAYPCFMTNEDLNQIRQQQKLTKQRPGCYGPWAKWRNATAEQIYQQLDQQHSFVIRLKSPGKYAQRIKWQDLIKGEINTPENDIDIVLLKSDGLPTYHLAHVIDDHLMRVTHVIRADEWLPSVPLHLQLFGLLGWQPPAYAHIAPIEKIDESSGYSSRRKLSKRKDIEANIDFYLEKGFTENAIIEYLMNIMDSSFEEWRKKNPSESLQNFKFSIADLSAHGALSDIGKLTNINRMVITKMDIETLYHQGLSWAKQWDQELADYMEKFPQETKAALNIEREGGKISKRISMWSDLKNQLFFVYDELFNKYRKFYLPEQITDADLHLLIPEFIQGYDIQWDKMTWLEFIKQISVKHGYAASVSDYKKNPQAYKGHFGDVAMLLRLAVCGTPHSPDLWEVMRVLGYQRVVQRLEQAAAA